MRVKVLLISILLLTPVGAQAQKYAIQGADRYFRIEASPAQGRRGPVVAGYVYNTYGYNADRVWLMVEALDAGGAVIGTTQSPVLGTVPNGGRAYFEVSAPPGGTTYRVHVTTYEWVGRGA